MGNACRGQQEAALHRERKPALRVRRIPTSGNLLAHHKGALVEDAMHQQSYFGPAREYGDVQGGQGLSNQHGLPRSDTIQINKAKGRVVAFAELVVFQEYDDDGPSTDILHLSSFSSALQLSTSASIDSTLDNRNGYDHPSSPRLSVPLFVDGDRNEAEIASDSDDCCATEPDVSDSEDFDH